MSTLVYYYKLMFNRAYMKCHKFRVNSADSNINRNNKQ